jgi:hypothetical protein
MSSREYVYDDELHLPQLTKPCEAYGGPTFENEVVRHRYGYFHGVDTPHFAARKKRGELLPLNAYVRYDEDRSGSYGGSVFYDERCIDPSWKCIGAARVDRRGWLVEEDDIQSSEQLQLEMLQDCNTTALLQEAIADAAPDLDALTTIIEAPKTVEMVVKARSNAERLIRPLRRAYRDVKTLRVLRPSVLFRDAKEVVRVLGSGWLEWRYGWRNLGFDIRDCATAFNQPKRLFVQGRSGLGGPQGVVTSTGTIPNYVSGIPGVDLQFEKTTQLDTSYRANFIGKYRVESVNGLLSPSVTSWEEIPLSWVADWFVTAGAAISAWVVLSSLERYHCSLGLKRQVTVDARITAATLSPGDSCAYSNPEGHGSAFTWKLTKLRWPHSVPSLTPQFRVRLNRERWLDALSLLATRIL